MQNVIISIGRNIPESIPLDDKAWLDYVVAVGTVCRLFGFRSGSTDCTTAGVSKYRDVEIVEEESFSWAFVLDKVLEDDPILSARAYLLSELESVRRRKSGGQWGIAVTIGETLFA